MHSSLLCRWLPMKIYLRDRKLILFQFYESWHFYSSIWCCTHVPSIWWTQSRNLIKEKSCYRRPEGKKIIFTQLTPKMLMTVVGDGIFWWKFSITFINLSVTDCHQQVSYVTKIWSPTSPVYIDVAYWDLRYFLFHLNHFQGIILIGLGRQKTFDLKCDPVRGSRTPFRLI